MSATHGAWDPPVVNAIPTETIVYNHLNQPRELVKGNVIGGIIG